MTGRRGGAAVLGRFSALDHKPWSMNVKHCLTARPSLRP